MKSEASSGTALAIREGHIELWRNPEWQRLWLAIQARPWRSLALLPAGEGAPVDATLRIAVTLARTGMVHLGSPIQVADATRVPLAYLSQFMEQVRRCTADGELILIALAPMEKNPVTVSLAQGADAVLLCVMLEQMTTSQAKKTVAQVGVNRFVGSVILSADGSLTPPEKEVRPRKA